jgi:hypothetical protein
MQIEQNGNRSQATFDVRFENIDDRSDFIDVATFGYGVDPQDKGPGKAMSYGVKYALLKVLGLETGDDPDEVQDASANHVETISDTQRDILQALIEASGSNIVSLCQFYKIKSLPDLPASKFAHAEKSLKNKLTKGQEA